MSNVQEASRKGKGFGGFKMLNALTRWWLESTCPVNFNTGGSSWVSVGHMMPHAAMLRSVLDRSNPSHRDPCGGLKCLLRLARSPFFILCSFETANVQRMLHLALANTTFEDAERCRLSDSFWCHLDDQVEGSDDYHSFSGFDSCCPHHG